MRWTVHVAYMGDLRNEYKIVVGNLGRKSLLGKFLNRLEGDIERDLKEIDGRVWTGFICFRIVTNGRLYEHGIEPSGSKKGREFLHWMNDC
jgi:hypothetical protein